jgi:hypothetical protein
MASGGRNNLTLLNLHAADSRLQTAICRTTFTSSGGQRVEDQGMQEKRAYPRFDVEIEGRLIFADGSCVLDCVIVDISESGARIKAALDVTAPPRAYLWQAKTATVFECEVRWQERKLIGLVFVDICGRQMRKSLIEACFPEHHKSRVARWLGQEEPPEK